MLKDLFLLNLAVARQVEMMEASGARRRHDIEARHVATGFAPVPLVRPEPISSFCHTGAFVVIEPHHRRQPMGSVPHR